VTEIVVFAPSDPSALEHFTELGWVLTETLDRAGIELLRGWVEEVAAWPDDDGEWLHHREMTDEGPKICRSENFTPFHAGLRNLLCGGEMLEVASLLLGEQAVLYKEKVNYKLPGGAGWAPHQDAPAYPFIESHVSCMVAIDDASPENGCLEVVSAMHSAVLEMDSAGCIAQPLVDSMDWQIVPVSAGQTLWFHSRTPHRSGTNTSSRSRRALYPTYNALSEGDLRDEYYRAKLEHFASGAPEGAGVQVSIIDDFLGRPV